MMNTMDRGLQLRKRRMAALRRCLGFPHTAPCTAGLNFACVDQPTDEILVGIAEKAIGDRCDSLLHCYSSIVATEVDHTVLVYRTQQGADLVEVALVERSKASSLQLVSLDGKRCFSVDSRFQLTETKAPPASKLAKALAAAKRRYAAALQEETAANASWDPHVVVFGTGPSGIAA